MVSHSSQTPYRILPLTLNPISIESSPESFSSFPTTASKKERFLFYSLRIHPTSSFCQKNPQLVFLCEFIVFDLYSLLLLLLRAYLFWYGQLDVKGYLSTTYLPIYCRS